MEKKGSYNPNTILVTNGVDFEAHAGPVPEPADLAAIPHPRIGYSGWIKKQLNWQLMVSLSRQHPEWSFVFVGGMSPHAGIAEIIQQLSTLTNVHFLGSKSSVEIAAYPQHFDVCIMPYHVDDYTKYIYPMKLHEYLAGGRPTVGTPIRSLEPFSEVIALVQSTDEWSAAISDALHPDANTEERRAFRQSVARKHDWEAVVFDIAKTIAHHLEPAASSRFEPPLARLASPKPKP
jgi:glycosyltransferase involved in cell wall biosynthesis